MFAVKAGYIEVLNLCTVEAKRKAKWHPQGQAAEDMRRRDWPLREVRYECDPEYPEEHGYLQA